MRRCSAVRIFSVFAGNKACCDDHWLRLTAHPHRRQRVIQNRICRIRAKPSDLICLPNRRALAPLAARARAAPLAVSAQRGGCKSSALLRMAVHFSASCSSSIKQHQHTNNNSTTQTHTTGFCAVSVCDASILLFCVRREGLHRNVMHVCELVGGAFFLPVPRDPKTNCCVRTGASNLARVAVVVVVVF